MPDDSLLKLKRSAVRGMLLYKYEEAALGSLLIIAGVVLLSFYAVLVRIR